MGDSSPGLVWMALGDSSAPCGGVAHGACTGIPTPCPRVHGALPWSGGSPEAPEGRRRLCLGAFGKERPLLLGLVCVTFLFLIGHGRDQGVSPRKRTVAEISRSRHGNDHNQSWKVSCGGPGETEKERCLGDPREGDLEKARGGGGGREKGKRTEESRERE